MKYRTIAAVLLAFSALQAAGGHMFSTMDANGNEVTSVLNPDGSPVATSNMVEKMIAAMPEPITPDYSTANTQLVATIEAVSPAPGNYAVVSNRAINAVTTNSLGSVTLSQVEDRNAENYDTYTVGHWMGAGFVITHGGDYYIVGYTFQKTALGWDNDVVAGKIRKMGAEGERCVTIGQYTSTAGTGNAAAGRYSFAEGNSTHAEGRYTHAEGAFTHAEGYCTHAEGDSTHAEGFGTHAEGAVTHAEGSYTHAEGRETRAGGDYTHAEGELTDAVGHCAHAEGFGTAAVGDSTHAEGISTHAGGTATHAEGVRSVATNDMTFVWQGAAGRPYTDYNPETYPQYGSHGNGTFNINPAPAVGETDVASGFYIGERSLKSRIDDAIAAINKVKQDKLPYPTNAIPQEAISGLSTGYLHSSYTYLTNSQPFVAAVEAEIDAKTTNTFLRMEWDNHEPTYTRIAPMDFGLGLYYREWWETDWELESSWETHGLSIWGDDFIKLEGGDSPGLWVGMDWEGRYQTQHGGTWYGNGFIYNIKGGEWSRVFLPKGIGEGLDNVMAITKDIDRATNAVVRGLSTIADVAAAATAATNYTDAAIGAAIAATNTVFSNAVLSVGLNIDTNMVAVLNEIADGFGNFPLSPGATRTTVGGLLLALAAAVVWLKRNKADKSEIRYSIPAAIYESGTLIDYAVNNVICGNASIVLTLPAQVANRARDFLVRIDRVTTSGNLGVNFASADAGGTEVSYETVDGSKPTIADGEITTLLFTEVASGRFMVAAKPAVRVIGGI